MQNCWVGQRPFQFCNPQIESISGWRWLDGHPMQNDGFGFQGFPWCYSAWKLLSSLWLFRMFISLQNVPRLSVSVERRHLPRVQSNDLFYMEQTKVIFVTIHQIYGSIVGFLVRLPTSCILRVVYADFMIAVMQIWCSANAASSIEWVVSTSHTFVEESERQLS